jgi:hypothetical protein
MSHLRWVSAFCCLAVLLSAASASADIVRPKQAKPKIEVRRDPKAEVSRLIIPRQFLPDGEQKVGAAPASTRTIVAGVALSAGIALCGLVLERNRGLRSPAVAGAIVLGGLVIGGGYVAANVPAAPPTPVPVDANAPPPPPTLVTVEDHDLSITITPDGDKVVLILNKGTQSTTFVPR